MISAKASRIFAVSGKRPLPISPLVSAPTSGSKILNPRCRKRLTLLVVAGSFHICGCIAGIIRTGTSAARIIFVNKSSARPAAIRAMRSAVAGAMMMKFAFFASETCRTSSTLSKTSVVTERPDSASHVAAPTKFRLDGVGTTVTRNPQS